MTVKTKEHTYVYIIQKSQDFTIMAPALLLRLITLMSYRNTPRIVCDKFCAEVGREGDRLVLTFWRGVSGNVYILIFSSILTMT